MKAILVIDISSHNEKNYYAEIHIKNKQSHNKVKTFAHCKLKPLPQKNKYDVEKYATVDYENNVTLGHFLNKGWNDCLDEILGETE